MLPAMSQTMSDKAAPAIVSRREWGARDSKAIDLLPAQQPLPFVYIHHSELGTCFDQLACSKEVQILQNDHMDRRGWDDIGYSFLIGGDGSIYEGRGWDRVGAHTKGHNSDGFGFSFIGNFETAIPPAAQIQSVQALIAYGVATKKIRPDYMVLGHRDVCQTTCPGSRLYSFIQSWPRYGQPGPVIG